MQAVCRGVLGQDDNINDVALIGTYTNEQTDRR